MELRRSASHYAGNAHQGIDKFASSALFQKYTDDKGAKAKVKNVAFNALRLLATVTVVPMAIVAAVKYKERKHSPSLPNLNQVGDPKQMAREETPFSIQLLGVGQSATEGETKFRCGEYHEKDIYFFRGCERCDPPLKCLVRQVPEQFKQQALQEATETPEGDETKKPLYLAEFHGVVENAHNKGYFYLYDDAGKKIINPDREEGQNEYAFKLDIANIHSMEVREGKPTT